MNVKELVITVIENIIKIVIIAVVVMYIFKGVTYAYNFGYKVFADEPMSANNGRIITVGIAENADAKDIGAMLEEKGLIEDQRLFVIQEYLSNYHNELKPGIYDLSTDMTPTQMIEILANGPMDIEDEDKPKSAEEIESSIDDMAIEEMDDFEDLEPLEETENLEPSEE